MTQENSGTTFPRELRDIAQWVVWRRQKRGNKTTKVPYNAITNEKGDVRDSKTWLPYSEAKDAAKYFSGLGFAFSPNDPYCGIDLDNCRDRITGDIAPWAADIIAQVDSYAEISPSDTGVHIILKGNAPDCRRGPVPNTDGAIEIYDRARFFTMTGKALPNIPDGIPCRQEALDAIFTQYFKLQDKGTNSAQQGASGTASDLMAHIRHSKQCEKFNRLMSGDLQGYPSPSEADFALLVILAWWSRNDAAIMREIALQSALSGRAKWDRDDYLDRSIASAISTNGDKGYDPEMSSPADDIKTNGLACVVADALWEYSAFARDGGNKLYRYDHGVYVPDADLYVAQQAKMLLKAWGCTKAWNKNTDESCVKWLLADAPILWDTPPLDKVNVLNGIVDIDTKTLEPHSAKYLYTTQLPVTFDPLATCPAWERFAKDLLPADCPNVLWEIFAFLMTPETSIQKAIMLMGEAGNGKSTLLEAIGAFLGSSNIVNMSLQRLEADRFSTASLYGKLANICADLPSADLQGTSIFKAITGGDRISGEHKYGRAFFFTPYARLIFSANTPPKSNDAGQAFYDRWIVLPMEKRMRGENDEIKRDVMRKQLQAEFSGVLNKALAAISKIRDKGIYESESMIKARDTFREMTDPFSIWTARHVSKDANHVVAINQIYRAYAAHCEKQGIPVPTQHRFGREVKRVFPYTAKAERHGKEVYTGIGLIEEDTSSLPFLPFSPIVTRKTKAEENKELHEERKEKELQLAKTAGTAGTIARNDPSGIMQSRSIPVSAALTYANAAAAQADFMPHESPTMDVMPPCEMGGCSHEAIRNYTFPDGDTMALCGDHYERISSRS